MLRAVAAAMAAMSCIHCAVAAESSAVAVARVHAAPGLSASEASIRFGSFAPARASQTITIHPDGGRTMRGIQPGDVRPARRFGPAGVVVRGERGMTFSVSLPSGAVLSSGRGTFPCGVLHVTDFRLLASIDWSRAGRVQTLFLGATASIPGKSCAGMYSGDVALNVAYD